MSYDTYISPLALRYAGKKMLYLFSPQYKYSTWRKLWLALAVAEQDAGLDIKDAQLEQLAQHLDDIDFEHVNKYERKFRHEVMAHIHAYGDQCPIARPIIHLGATSCFVTDNGDLIQMKEALELIKAKLVQVIRYLVRLAKQYQNLPCLSFTHFQSAQPSTLGKRCCIWIQDFLMDLIDVQQRISSFPFLGVKGTTGTQAAFLSLLDNNHEKVKSLDKAVAKKMGFSKLLRVTGQTYPRKIDIQVSDLLTSVAVSAHKLSSDIRLLAHLKEVEEPFEKHQIGSSAMPYKNNPIRSERICSLARFVISLGENPKYTAANQWLERSLDDSANRRLSISESFLATDAILNLLMVILSDLHVYPKIIHKHLMEELPFISTENILMEMVKKGGDRQVIHEKLRQHALNSHNQIKESGLENDLLDRIKNDPSFSLTDAEMEKILKMDNFIGRSSQQVEEFLQNEVRPILENYEDLGVPLEEIPV